MEIRHLNTFKAIIQTGNFSKAAELLNYSQSTVTFHIKAIEDELGAPIFDRIGKKVLLTEAGKKLLPYAIQILNAFGNLKEAVGEQGEIRGQLRITAPEALLIYRLPPLLKELKEDFPGIEIQLQHLDPINWRTDLSTGNVDLALVIEKDKNEDNHIILEKLCDETMALISAKPIKLNELHSLKGQVFLLTEKECSYRAIFERIIMENIPDTSPEYWKQSSIEFWSIDAIKQCIMCGFGIGLLPYSTVSQEISKGFMYAQPLPSSENLSVYLSYHKDKWLSPSMRTFLTLLRKHASKWNLEMT
ncbi:LysR family transcriptional regulator [Anoxybacillus rupiensis]|jgi:DNA-binding transcriptional LysR family regulator|uniref:LysR family transcriptional regulator n=1 Tax=Anoxybacteroides rupiense TaxID=311460 RepID=UPI001BA7B65D|nr:LysR family transcriptional regulator [Anoxybacillus rupiensis]MBS2771151.1 LysR family transcriptional regulator [Anoxybacillus rupiensis]